MTILSSAAVDALKTKLEAACSDPEKGLPGASVAVVGKDGRQLFSHAAGQRGIRASETMDQDTVFWIASCTKLITAIACMQLVEQGKLLLDDPDFIERLCPELKDVQVLRDDGTLEEKEDRITLRMLLSHTAGFGYTFLQEKLMNYGRPIGFDEFSGRIADFKQPLVHQPGKAWEYGVNMDWVGILIERTTNQSLNDYFHQHIFEPLELSHISMIPTAEMKKNLAYMHQRDKTGQLSVRDHLLHRPLVFDENDAKSFCYSGGAGGFSTPADYCQILAVLLNDGTSPTTGKQLLQKSTVDEMFRNQIAHLPPLTEKPFPDAKPEFANPSVGAYPTVEGDRQGWGLSFLISGGKTGRSLSTAHWTGLPNVFWWCDREQGVAGIVCTQILPFGDRHSFGLWLDVETGVYSGIGRGKL